MGHGRGIIGAGLAVPQGGGPAHRRSSPHNTVVQVLLFGFYLKNDFLQKKLKENLPLIVSPRPWLYPQAGNPSPLTPALSPEGRGEITLAGSSSYLWVANPCPLTHTPYANTVARASILCSWGLSQVRTPVPRAPVLSSFRLGKTQVAQVFNLCWRRLKPAATFCSPEDGQIW